MKTLFTGVRLFIDENTSEEISRSISFFLDNVQVWESGEKGLFKNYNVVTIVRLDNQSSYCIKIDYNRFNQIMLDFLNRQGDIIIQMKQN